MLVYLKPIFETSPKMYEISDVIVYLQNECIEKHKFDLRSKYDREHDFDSLLG